MRNALLRPLLTGLAVLGATSAMAGDLLPPPPPPPPQTYMPEPLPEPVPAVPLRPAYYGWEGTYAGGFVGPLCADAKSKAIRASTKSTEAWSATAKDCIATGGALIGYNAQVGDIVWGIEADYALGGSFRDKGTLGTKTVTYQAEFNPITTLRGRVGMGSENTLYYLTAGAGFIGGKANGEKAWHTGWVAGAGVERRLGERLNIRGEVLYGDFSKENYNNNCCKGSIDLNNVTMFRVGLTWNFGALLAPKPAYMPPPPPPYVGVGG